MDAFEQLIGSLFTKPHDGKEQAHEKSEMDLADKANDLEQRLKGIWREDGCFCERNRSIHDASWRGRLRL